VAAEVNPVPQPSHFRHDEVCTDFYPPRQLQNETYAQQ